MPFEHGGRRRRRRRARPRALSEAVGPIDRAVLGYERPGDHAWLRRDGRLGWLYRDETGRPLGYGYVTRVGRIGPVADLEPGLLTPVVGAPARRPRAGRRLEPLGARRRRRHRDRPGAGRPPAGVVPGALLLERPIADFERYLPITLALV